MIFQIRPLQLWLLPALLGMMLFPAGALRAGEVILLMKSGDLISGTVVSESTNQMVISNSWSKALSVPLAEVAERKTMAVAQAATPAPAPVAPPVAVTPPPPVKLATGTPSMAKPAAPKGKWHGEVDVGLDALFSTVNRQDYFAHGKLTYEQAYAAHPKEFFRNTTQTSGDYQKTDDEVSANNFNINNKSDFDFDEKSYGYVSEGGGFDRVSKIDSQYQGGGGIGRHAIKLGNFVLNIETGLDYQSQSRSDDSNLESVYGRLAEDLTWSIRKNLTLTQNVAFYDNLERAGQYHGSLISKLSYGFWENLSLNLQATESYTTEVARDVQRNTFEVRFTLGVTF